MKVTVKMPKVGDSTDDVVVIDVGAAPGDVVDVGQTILTVEANKANAEIPSPVAGTVSEVLVKNDDELAIGMPVLVVETGT